MKVALENFAAMRTDRPKLAILGGMKELGNDSRAEHESIVRAVNELGLHAVFVGPEFAELAGMGLITYPDANAALEASRRKPLTGYVILVKGSRGTRLETLVEGL
jgi:UDP-N-acetylmuramoyl-tripeptide--D-alanyl-D-alanine ligase